VRCRSTDRAPGGWTRRANDCHETSELVVANCRGGNSQHQASSARRPRQPGDSNTRVGTGRHGSASRPSRFSSALPAASDDGDSSDGRALGVRLTSRPMPCQPTAGASPTRLSNVVPRRIAPNRPRLSCCDGRDRGRFVAHSGTRGPGHCSSDARCQTQTSMGARGPCLMDRRVERPLAIGAPFHVKPNHAVGLSKRASLLKQRRGRSQLDPSSHSPNQAPYRPLYELRDKDKDPFAPAADRPNYRSTDQHPRTAAARWA
jgi:hypothetical protein